MATLADVINMLKYQGTPLLPLHITIKDGLKTREYVSDIPTVAATNIWSSTNMLITRDVDDDITGEKIKAADFYIDPELQSFYQSRDKQCDLFTHACDNFVYYVCTKGRRFSVDHNINCYLAELVLANYMSLVDYRDLIIDHMSHLFFHTDVGFTLISSVMPFKHSLYLPFDKSESGINLLNGRLCEPQNGLVRAAKYTGMPKNYVQVFINSKKEMPRTVTQDQYIYLLKVMRTTAVSEHHHLVFVLLFNFVQVDDLDDMVDQIKSIFGDMSPDMVTHNHVYKILLEALDNNVVRKQFAVVKPKKSDSTIKGASALAKLLLMSAVTGQDPGQLLNALSNGGPLSLLARVLGDDNNDDDNGDDNDDDIANDNDDDIANGDDNDDDNNDNDDNNDDDNDDNDNNNGDDNIANGDNNNNDNNNDSSNNDVLEEVD